MVIPTKVLLHGGGALPRWGLHDADAARQGAAGADDGGPEMLTQGFGLEDLESVVWGLRFRVRASGFKPGRQRQASRLGQYGSSQCGRSRHHFSRGCGLPHAEQPRNDFLRALRRPRQPERQDGDHSCHHGIHIWPS